MKTRRNRQATGPPPHGDTATVATSRHRRGRWAAACLAIVAAATGAWVAFLIRNEPLPSPPEIDLSAASPSIRRAVIEARTRVLASPDSAAAWGRLGMVLLAHEYTEPTTFCLSQAARLDPEEFLWVYLLGVHTAVSDPAAAARRFEQAAQLRSDEAIVHARLGELLLHREQFEQAGVHLRKAADLEPNRPRPHVALARLALARGDPESALPWAEFAVRVAPQERATQETLALVYQRLGRRDEALETLAKAEELPATPLGWDDPFAAQVLALRQDVGESRDVAEALLAEGRVWEAVAVLEAALERDRSDPAIYVALARSHLAANQPQQAEAVLKAAQERHPVSAEVRFQQGVARFVAGDFHGAEESFQAAIERKRVYPDAHYNLGHARLRLGDEPGAQAAFREAIRFRPDFAHAHTNLAKLLWKSGLGEEAAHHLRISLDLDPQDPEAQNLARELGAAGGPSPRNPAK